MPIHKFAEELDDLRSQEMHRLVTQAQSLADTFYNNQFRHHLRNASTQSMSVDEIFMGIASELQLAKN